MCNKRVAHVRVFCIAYQNQNHCDFSLQSEQLHEVYTFGMEEVISKRLHVSGLTQAITPDDLSQRLGSFGTVRALDGFNMLDAVGQPRRFGYVTLETTKRQLGRCMLSPSASFALNPTST